MRTFKKFMLILQMILLGGLYTFLYNEFVKKENVFPYIYLLIVCLLGIQWTAALVTAIGLLIKKQKFNRWQVFYAVLGVVCIIIWGLNFKLEHSQTRVMIGFFIALLLIHSYFFYNLYFIVKSDFQSSH